MKRSSLRRREAEDTSLSCKEETIMIRTALTLLAVAAIPATSAFGAVIFYDNEADFLAQMSGAGYGFEGLETFEGNNVGPGNVVAAPGPLQGGVPWLDDFGLGFPDGLEQMNLYIDSTNGLDVVLLTDGFAGNDTDVVGANTFVEHTIVGFQNGMTGGVSLKLMDLINGGLADIDVYDVDNNLIASTTANAPFQGAFFGVYSDAPIGYLEIAAQFDGGEIIDNVEMYNIPGPAALSLLALAGLARRRRR
jgi:hypothetical protein